jgi:hypothetical protein
VLVGWLTDLTSRVVQSNAMVGIRSKELTQVDNDIMNMNMQHMPSMSISASTSTKSQSIDSVAAPSNVPAAAASVHSNNNNSLTDTHNNINDSGNAGGTLPATGHTATLTIGGSRGTRRPGFTLHRSAS